MIAKLLFATAACCIALATPATRVTETTLPLADERASAFYFVGDIALAVDYDGGGKVTGRINAYDLTKSSFAWRQEVRVQETDKSPGSWIMADGSRNRVLMGNGPLTALDLPTGRPLWSLDCKTAGSVDLGRSSFFTDGDVLLLGTKDCGDLDHKRLLRIDGATGAVRWQADAEVHAYKTGNIEHRDFAYIQEGKPTATDLLEDTSAAGVAALIDMLSSNASPPPTQVLIAGKRLSGIDYRTGRQNWMVKDEPGRWVPMTTNGLSLWVDDGKLVAYSTRDGSRQWAYDMDAPWPILLPLDTTATSDFLAVTWRNAHRIDRAGRAKWTLKREDETWGQLITPEIFILTMKMKTYAAVDIATGQIRWKTRIDSDRSARIINEELSSARTGMVLIAGYDNSRSGPFELTGLDAATGKVAWSVDRMNNRKLLRYWVVDATRIVVFDEDYVHTELDVRTGAPIGGYKGKLPSRSGTASLSMNGYRVWYGDKKVLTCNGPNGQVVWQRKGERSENAAVTVLAQGIVVWPTQDGSVELIDLASGATVHKTMGNKKPYIGVDAQRGLVLVPQGKTLKLLTIASTS